jgi:hypothetical protein
MVVYELGGLEMSNTDGGLPVIVVAEPCPFRKSYPDVLAMQSA